jgi:hypothetical protein
VEHNVLPVFDFLGSPQMLDNLNSFAKDLRKAITRPEAAGDWVQSTLISEGYSLNLTTIECPSRVNRRLFLNLWKAAAVEGKADEIRAEADISLLRAIRAWLSWDRRR